MGAQGRALSVARGAGFSADNWLQDDGDLAVQTEAYARAGFSGPKGARAFELDGWRGMALSGKAAGQALAAACAWADLVVMPAAVAAIVPKPKNCIVIDRTMLDQTGALALSVQEGRLVVHPTRAAQRIWMAEKPIWQDRSLAKPGALLARQ